MKSEKWKNCVGAVRNHLRAAQTGTDSHARELKTQRQWAELGMLALSDDAGKLLWVNQHCQNQVRYLFPDEVRTASQEELNAYFAPIRQRRRELARLRKAEAQRQEEKREAHYQHLTEKAWELENEFRYHRLRSVKALQTLSRQLAERCKSPVVSADTVILDCETTGLDVNELEVLEMSIISGEGDVLYHGYIKPFVTESWEDAQKVNHISPEMVEDAPTMAEEGGKIRSILEQSRTIVGYNVDFDLGIVRAWTGFKPENHIVIDLMEKYARINGEWDEYRQNYRWKSLSVCADHYGYTWEGEQHDSLADCKATLYVYHKMEDD